MAKAVTIGTRPTRQRKAVVAALGDTDVFRSAQDIHAALRERGDDVGLTTVYRLCSSGHHHHLVCRGCGLTVEIEGPAVETWARKTAREHGFAEVEHTLEIFGTCRSCAS
jgi:Fur family ferric uptake transcriptional regulator